MSDQVKALICKAKNGSVGGMIFLTYIDFVASKQKKRVVVDSEGIVSVGKIKWGEMSLWNTQCAQNRIFRASMSPEFMEMVDEFLCPKEYAYFMDCWNHEFVANWMVPFTTQMRKLSEMSADEPDVLDNVTMCKMKNNICAIRTLLAHGIELCDRISDCVPKLTPTDKVNIRPFADSAGEEGNDLDREFASWMCNTPLPVTIDNGTLHDNDSFTVATASDAVAKEACTNDKCIARKANEIIQITWDRFLSDNPSIADLAANCDEFYGVKPRVIPDAKSLEYLVNCGSYNCAYCGTPLPKYIQSRVTSSGKATERDDAMRQINDEQSTNLVLLWEESD